MKPAVYLKQKFKCLISYRVHTRFSHFSFTSLLNAMCANDQFEMKEQLHPVSTCNLILLYRCYRNTFTVKRCRNKKDFIKNCKETLLHYGK